jgi:hypothetical protein
MAPGLSFFSGCSSINKIDRHYKHVTGILLKVICDVKIKITIFFINLKPTPAIEFECLTQNIAFIFVFKGTLLSSHSQFVLDVDQN